MFDATTKSPKNATKTMPKLQNRGGKVFLTLASMFGKSWILSVVFVICVFFSSSVVANEAKTYKIGILAKRGAERCLAKWTPTADYLTETIENADFEIVPLSFEQIYPTIEAGEVDFVIANPFFYVNLEAKYGAGRIATLKNLRQGKVCTVFGGVMFTKVGSGINKLIDLWGKKFMGTEKTSFGGWQIAWRELKVHGIDPHKDFADLQFGGTHDAVVYAVRDGKVDAGAVRTDTLERMAVEGKIDIDDYKILFDHNEHKHLITCSDTYKSFPFAHSARLYPEWPFAKTAETSDEIAEKVTAALLSMSADSDAAKVARCAGWTIPHNYTPVHDCLRELRIAPYEDYGKITIAELVRQDWPWLLGAGVMLTIIAFAIRTRRLNIKLAKTIVLRRQAERKFRTLYEFSGDAIMMLDEKGFFDCNEATVKLFGCRNKEEICIRHPADLSPAVQPNGCDSMDYARNNIAIALKKGSYRFEHLHRRLDGTEFPADVLLNAMEIDGKRVLQAIVRDITERKKAEMSLRDSEHKYRMLIENANDAIFLADAKTGIILAANAKAAELMGLPVDEIIGMHQTQLHPKEDTAKYKQMFIDNANGENATHYDSEAYILRKDGVKVPIEINDSVIDIKGQKVIQGIFRDITERKQAENEIKNLAKFPSENPNPVLRISKDGEVLYSNEAGNLLLAKWKSATGKTVPEKWRNIIAEAFASGKDAEEEEEEVKGEVFSFTIAPVKEAGYANLYACDITDRKQAEERIKKQQYYLEKAQELGRIGTWELDLRRNRLYWTDENCRIFGVPAGSVVNYEVFLATVHPDDREYVDREWTAALDGKPYDIEHRIVINGITRWVREKADVEFDEERAAVNAIGFTQDITERKQAGQNIQEYQERLKALVFQLTIAEEKERRRIAEDLHDNVGQSLAFARMRLASAQKIVSGEKLVSVMDDLTESLLQASQDTRNVIFDLSSPVMNELGLAAAIPEWLEAQIGNQYGLKTEFIDNVDDSDKKMMDENVRAILFRNVRELLTNVVKHARADKVSVYLEQANNNVKIIVQDDGVGFDSREANEGVNRKGSFGLFSIQERMKDLGGSMEIVSEPGKGCKAVLTMPLAPDNCQEGKQI